jgi:hypothetical protein
MAAPAVKAALEAVIAKIEAIAPIVDAGTPFRRQDERAPSSTRQRRRLFDLQAGGHPRDLSNEGAGVQNPGLADRIAAVTFLIEYALGRNERELEMLLMQDSELVLRAIGRSANWAGTPVRRVVAKTSIDRSSAEPMPGEGAGFLTLVVEAEITYRDTE